MVTLGQIKAEHGNLDSNISSSQESQAFHQLKELVPAPKVAGLPEPASQPGLGGKLLGENTTQAVLCKEQILPILLLIYVSINGVIWV